VRLETYLERITFDGALSPTFDTLAQLLAHHVRTIPFENLDVQLGRPLTTNPAEAYDKIILNRRGGWCYEQNGLFGWALTEIGFDVTRVSAAVMRAKRGDVADANHLCLIVRLNDTDQLYLVDVGFGGSMIKPIPLKSSEHEQTPYRIGLRRTDDGRWQFWEDLGKGEFTFDFEAIEADEAALDAKCEFLQTDASSGFVQNLVAQIRLPDAQKTVRGKLFSHATPNGVETRVIESPGELASLLADSFYLDVSEVAGLWPKIEARHEDLQREKALTDTYEVLTRPDNQSLG